MDSLASRTAARRAQAKGQRRGIGGDAARLGARWRAYVSAELHSAMARILVLLAAGARKGPRPEF